MARPFGGRPVVPPVELAPAPTIDVSPNLTSPDNRAALRIAAIATAESLRVARPEASRKPSLPPRLCPCAHHTIAYPVCKITTGRAATAIAGIGGGEALRDSELPVAVKYPEWPPSACLRDQHVADPHV